MNRKLNFRAAWIACFAILLAAVAPSISHAIAAKRASTAAMHEICIAAGVQADDQAGHARSDEAPPDQSMHTGHCPFCASHVFTPALPAAEFALQPPAGSLLIPALFRASSCSLFAWAAAQARAPPRR